MISLGVFAQVQYEMRMPAIRMCGLRLHAFSQRGSGTTTLQAASRYGATIAARAGA
jgi:hypothetical protein